MTKYRKYSNKKYTKKMRGGEKKNKTGKKWTTAINAATSTLKKTGSLNATKKSLKKASFI